MPVSTGVPNPPAARGKHHPPRAAARGGARGVDQIVASVAVDVDRLQPRRDRHAGTDLRPEPERAALVAEAARGQAVERTAGALLHRGQAAAAGRGLRGLVSELPAAHQRRAVMEDIDAVETGDLLHLAASQIAAVDLASRLGLVDEIHAVGRRDSETRVARIAHEIHAVAAVRGVLGIAEEDLVARPVADAVHGPGARGRLAHRLDARVGAVAVLVDQAVGPLDLEPRRAVAGRAVGGDARVAFELGAVLGARHAVAARGEPQLAAVEAETVLQVVADVAGNTVLRHGARAARDRRQSRDRPADPGERLAHAARVDEAQLRDQPARARRQAEGDRVARLAGRRDAGGAGRAADGGEGVREPKRQQYADRPASRDRRASHAAPSPRLNDRRGKLGGRTAQCQCPPARASPRTAGDHGPP